MWTRRSRRRRSDLAAAVSRIGETERIQRDESERNPCPPFRRREVLFVQSLGECRHRAPKEASGSWFTRPPLHVRTRLAIAQDRGPPLLPRQSLLYLQQIEGPSLVHVGVLLFFVRARIDLPRPRGFRGFRDELPRSPVLRGCHGRQWLEATPHLASLQDRKPRVDEGSPSRAGGSANGQREISLRKRVVHIEARKYEESHATQSPGPERVVTEDAGSRTGTSSG